jgi:hypothetical protein
MTLGFVPVEAGGIEVAEACRVGTRIQGYATLSSDFFLIHRVISPSSSPSHFLAETVDAFVKSEASYGNPEVFTALRVWVESSIDSVFQRYKLSQEVDESPDITKYARCSAWVGFFFFFFF